MNQERITISIPKYLGEELKKLVEKRKLSSFVTKALERQILEEKIENPIRAFLSLRKKLPKLSQRRIISAIKRGKK